MDLLDDLDYDSTLEFNFNYKETPAKVLIDVKNLSFGYTPDNILFKNISFVLEKGERLGIIGKNGKGKSTLLNTIAGELKAVEGEVHMHPSTAFAHFGQTNIARLHPTSTVLDEIHSANTKLSAQTIRGIAGAMMFSGDSADKKVSLLSGGEKSRVMLGQILAREVNVLFLDEPTNHLDMDSIEALTKAIENYDGSVIVVTHSEELLRRVCDRLIIFTRNGAEYFDGGYDLFLEKMGWEEEEEERAKQKPKSTFKDNKKAKSDLIRDKNKIVSPIKKKIEKLEASIIKSEETLASHQKKLLEASNKGDTFKIIEFSKLVSLEQKEVEKMFELLEILQSEFDEISQDYDKKIAEVE